MIALRDKRTGSNADCDMTPMVDVTFLLLIFFMVTTAFAMQRSLAVPKLGSGGPVLRRDNTETKADIVVEIDEFNTYHVSTDAWEQEAPSEHDLIRALRRSRSNAHHNKPVNHLLVKASPESLHEKVVAALDSGAYVGIPEIELLTLAGD
jgi:biopolymer transport protein ExbD